MLVESHAMMFWISIGICHGILYRMDCGWFLFGLFIYIYVYFNPILRGQTQDTTREQNNQIRNVCNGLGQSNPQHFQQTRAVKSTICSKGQGNIIHSMFKAPGQSNPQYVQETSAIERSIYSRDQDNRIHKMSKGLGQSNPQYVQGTRAVKSTICPKDQGSQIHNISKGPRQ